MAPFITQLALAPLAATIEAEFSHVILNDDARLVIDLAGLQRGSFSTQTAALCAMVQAGILSPNDARLESDFPPHPDGDGLQRSGATNWPADGTGLPHMAQSPGPRGDGPPEPGTHENEGAAG
jgi:hypothetical protein